MKENKKQLRRNLDSPLRNMKPALLTLAIIQALAFQAAQAASIEVTSNLDDGTDCTLREALTTINAGVDRLNGCIINSGVDAIGTNDTITFGSAVSGQTITLAQGNLSISKDVSINPGGVNTTIDANGVGRVISVGPAFYYNGPTVELDQLTLTGGMTTNEGGAISIAFNSSITLINSTVSGNRDESLGGGGISIDFYSSITLKNSTVSGNTTTGEGGGIFAQGESSVTLINSTVSGNSHGSHDNAGGIAASYSNVTLMNSTVSGNPGDGIYAANGSGVTLNNSTVSGNEGSGIFAGNLARVALSNSTVSGNDGGGIFATFETSVTLSNSTVSGNKAGNYGAGGITADTYSPVTLSNSIVANSIGADCGISYNSTVTATADSIIEDGSCGTAAMAVDPVLGPLDDNGGPTQTHALLAGSPAIDNGTGAGATAADQRGVAAVGVRDSGAYEFTGDMNALTIEKLINNRIRQTPGEAAQLLAGTRYRANYKVTNNLSNRIYSVRVFESGQLVCDLYSLEPGESKQPYRCGSNQAVLVGDNNVPASVTAKVSGSSEELTGQTNAYYTGHSNVPGKLNVTHYVNEKNADTQATAVDVNSNQAEVKFRIENTGSIELYRVKLYHDPASPINYGWQQLCFKGTLVPGEVRYCKRKLDITVEGLNKAFGRAQGLNANVGATGYVNAADPSYFNVVLP